MQLSEKKGATCAVKSPAYNPLLIEYKILLMIAIVRDSALEPAQ